MAEVPATPGVYRVLSSSGDVVYVGKAKNLRRRLAQYKNARRRKAHRKMRAIVGDAHSITWECLPSDLEAGLHELKLIQDLRPKWNVQGAFAFLYPLIGASIGTREARFCFTTHPERHPEFSFYGAYRSRFITGSAFFSLMKLLRFVGSGRPIRDQQKGSYVFSYRQLPERWVPHWEQFFRGESPEILESLVLKLLESSSARALREEVQEKIDTLGRFWKHEAERLRNVIRFTGYRDYPVPQNERDLLFLRYRMRGMT